MQKKDSGKEQHLQNNFQDQPKRFNVGNFTIKSAPFSPKADLKVSQEVIKQPVEFEQKPNNNFLSALHFPVILKRPGEKTLINYQTKQIKSGETVPAQTAQQIPTTEYNIQKANLKQVKTIGTRQNQRSEKKMFDLTENNNNNTHIVSTPYFDKIKVNFAIEQREPVLKTSNLLQLQEFRHNNLQLAKLETKKTKQSLSSQRFRSQNEGMEFDKQKPSTVDNVDYNQIKEDYTKIECNFTKPEIDGQYLKVDGKEIGNVILEDSFMFEEDNDSQIEKKNVYFDEQRDKLRNIMNKQSQEELGRPVNLAKKSIRSFEKLQKTKIYKINPTIQIVQSLKELDNYILGDVLGRGSYATVKLGTHKLTNQKVAIKMYDKARLYDPQKTKNVHKEIEILRSCDHPNIIRLLQVVETQKYVNLILEMGGTNSLKQVLKSKHNRKLQQEDIIPIFRQILQGIQYIHDKNIIHRDIKLDNILVDENKHVHIIDFGFATQAPPSPNFLTKSCGTPPYMSPEMVPPLPKYNQLTDVWSCGIVLHLMVTGKFPYTAKSEKELYKKIKKGISSKEEIEDEISEVLQSCLEINFQSRKTAGLILKSPYFYEYT